jgi:hypothetical protein
MVSIKAINNLRINFGYISHHFKSYKNYCNKMKASHKGSNDDMYLMFALESNMAKFKMLNSIQFLYKNLRLLKKAENKDKTYGEYLKCIIDGRKNEVEIDRIVDLRNKVAEYYAFLDDIYILNDNRHDFEQYKIRYNWHDITLVFETQKILESFLNGTFSFCDFRFNTQLANKILEVERNINILKTRVKETEIVIEIFECVRILSLSISNLERFLNDNFVESSYVLDLKMNVDKILAYVKSILDYQNGNLETKIDKFVAPNIFKEIEPEFNHLNKIKQIDSSKLHEILINKLEKRLRVDTRPRKMPFLPVFYDIAYDFIEYSKSAEPVSGMLQKCDPFNKK